MAAALLARAARFVGGCSACQRHAHAALEEGCGFAEQTQFAFGNTQRLFHALKSERAGFHAAIDHRRGAGRFHLRRHRQAQNGAGMQRELALELR